MDWTQVAGNIVFNLSYPALSALLSRNDRNIGAKKN